MNPYIDVGLALRAWSGSIGRQQDDVRGIHETLVFDSSGIDAVGFSGSNSPACPIERAAGQRVARKK